MKATIIHGAGDLRVEEVADPVIQQPTDAIVRTVRTCICGSDLHPYHSMKPSSRGQSMGHELLGVVEETGAVGLSAVLAAAQMGAETIILMGRHRARTDLGVEWGATHVVAERGDEGVQRVLDITDGLGTHAVLEAVGHMPAYEQSFRVARTGGVISRVGVPQYEEAGVGFRSLFGRNLTLTGGLAVVAMASIAVMAVIERRMARPAPPITWSS